MKLFEISKDAKSDLISIARFTEKRWSKDQRNLYLKQMDDAFYLLGTNPEIGIECNHIREGYRKFPQGSHIIFYKNGTDSNIFVVRVLHKSMDYELRL